MLTCVYIHTHAKHASESPPTAARRSNQCTDRGAQSNGPAKSHVPPPNASARHNLSVSPSPRGRQLPSGTSESFRQTLIGPWYGGLGAFRISSQGSCQLLPASLTDPGGANMCLSAGASVPARSDQQANCFKKTSPRSKKPQHAGGKHTYAFAAEHPSNSAHLGPSAWTTVLCAPTRGWRACSGESAQCRPVSPQMLPRPASMEETLAQPAALVRTATCRWPLRHLPSLSALAMVE